MDEQTCELTHVYAPAQTLSLETNQIRSVMAALQQRQEQMQQQLQAVELRLEDRGRRGFKLW